LHLRTMVVWPRTGQHGAADEDRVLHGRPDHQLPGRPSRRIRLRHRHRPANARPPQPRASHRAAGRARRMGPPPPTPEHRSAAARLGPRA
jgi:hypothetical protein